MNSVIFDLRVGSDIATKGQLGFVLVMMGATHLKTRTRGSNAATYAVMHFTLQDCVYHVQVGGFAVSNRLAHSFLP